MTTIRYYDAFTEEYVQVNGKLLRSGAGYSAGPEYGVLYQLDNGHFLGGVRHQDRGDLMTEVRYSLTKSGAMPRRWR